MRNRKKTGKRWIIRFGYTVLMALLAAAVYWAGGWGIFSIKTISCRVDKESLCSDELNAELRQYLGRNLLSIRKTEIEKRIISADRLAETVKVNLRLPDSLGVEIVSRKAAAAITTAESIAEAVEVDKEGVILRKTERVGPLPRLIWADISQWSIEDRVPQYIIKAMNVAGLGAGGFKLTGVPKVESESSLVMVLDSGQKVWLSLADDPVEQLTRLQVILNQVRIEGKSVREIDMRFERPVVR